MEKIWADSGIVPAERRRTAVGRSHSSTRERLLREIESRREVTTSQLVDATGLHENTVRGHLERLRADGHIRRERDIVASRGRPAWRWLPVSPAQLGAYAGLATTLAAALEAATSDPIVPARKAGASWGRQLLTERSATIAQGADETGSRALVIDIMREQGFAPADDGEIVRLRACPLLAAATRNEKVVCAVHEGMIEGIASAYGTDLESKLVPFADGGACALHLRAVS